MSVDLPLIFMLSFPNVGNPTKIHFNGILLIHYEHVISRTGSISCPNTIHSALAVQIDLTYPLYAWIVATQIACPWENLEQIRSPNAVSLN